MPKHTRVFTVTVTVTQRSFLGFYYVEIKFIPLNYACRQFFSLATLTAGSLVPSRHFYYFIIRIRGNGVEISRPAASRAQRSGYFGTRPDYNCPSATHPKTTFYKISVAIKLRKISA